MGLRLVSKTNCSRAGEVELRSPFASDGACKVLALYRPPEVAYPQGVGRLKKTITTNKFNIIMWVVGWVEKYIYSASFAVRRNFNEQ